MRPYGPRAQITRLSQTSRCANPSGYLVSVLGVDCMQLSMSITQMPTEVVGVLVMPLIVYLLAARVGTDPALCCAAWMLGSLLLIIPVARLQNAIWVCVYYMGAVRRDGGAVVSLLVEPFLVHIM